MSLSLSRSQFCFPVAQCEFGVTPISSLPRQQAPGLIPRVPKPSWVSQMEHSGSLAKTLRAKDLEHSLPIKKLGTDLPVWTGLKKFTAG